MRPCTVLDKLTNCLRVPIFPLEGELFSKQISESAPLVKRPRKHPVLAVYGIGSYC